MGYPWGSHSSLITIKQDNTTMSNRVIVKKQKIPEEKEVFVLKEYKDFLIRFGRKLNGTQ